MNKKEIISYAPGRINIIGEHTDYNGGFVLPAAIDKRTSTRISINGHQSRCQFISKNFDAQFEFDLTDFAPSSNGWHNYAMGVVHELMKLGAVFTGFDVEIYSDVPVGGGVSSSAALECSIAYGLNTLFSLGFDEWQIIKACQMAEHHFAGIKCGIMDQFTSVMGLEKKVILLDCSSLEYEYFPLDLLGYQFVLLDTKVSHELANSEYNTRRKQCESGVTYLQQYDNEIRSLRDVNMSLLDSKWKDMEDEVYARCKHVVTENSRVLEATQALRNNHLEYLGQLIYDSHDSLQHDFKVSCGELDFLVDQTRDKPYVLGSRMMGGGFGGSTINLIKDEHVDRFIDEMSQIYLEKYALDLGNLKVTIGDGAKQLNNTTVNVINN